MDELRTRLAAEISAAVAARLGEGDAQVSRIIKEEVVLALGDRPLDPAFVEAVHQRNDNHSERIVVTATGPNRPGIVARLAAVIDEFAGDIRDISQTIVAGYFTMLFVVDISGATRQGTTFVTLRERLREVAADLGIHVVALHADILSAMHEV
jgi:ACT domain-containing protein